MEISNQEYFQLIKDQARLNALKRHIEGTKNKVFYRTEIEAIIKEEYFDDIRRTKQN